MGRTGGDCRLVRGYRSNKREQVRFHVGKAQPDNSRLDGQRLGSYLYIIQWATACKKQNDHETKAIRDTHATCITRAQPTSHTTAQTVSVTRHCRQLHVYSQFHTQLRTLLGTRVSERKKDPCQSTYELQSFTHLQAHQTIFRR